MTKLKSVLGKAAVFAPVLFLGFGASAHAQMYDVASSTAALNAFYGDVGTLIALGVGVVLGAAAALIGLGWAYRSAKKHVTGRKF